MPLHPPASARHNKTITAVCANCRMDVIAWVMLCITSPATVPKAIDGTLQYLRARGRTFHCSSMHVLSAFLPLSRQAASSRASTQIRLSTDNYWSSDIRRQVGCEVTTG